MITFFAVLENVLGAQQNSADIQVRQIGGRVFGAAWDMFTYTVVLFGGWPCLNDADSKANGSKAPKALLNKQVRNLSRQNKLVRTYKIQGSFPALYNKMGHLYYLDIISLTEIAVQNDKCC